MLPREHGAYGQLLLPLVTAMAMGRPSAAALALASCAIAAFAAHEPLLVMVGRRGGRAQRDHRARAVRWLSACAAAALVSGVAAFALLDPVSRWLTLVPAAFAAVSAVMLAGGAERTTGGELVVASTLASVSLPLAVASGASLAAGVTCAATFAAVFAAATVSVRAVIARARGGSAGERRVALATDTVLFAAVAALALARVLLPAAVWAAAPVCGVAIVLAAFVPPARYLRPIGWSLVAATALTSGILIVAAR